nr:leucine-rich repeat domain-containing protein [Candidatus Sigynarchaeota archaeon]
MVAGESGPIHHSVFVHGKEYTINKTIDEYTKDMTIYLDLTHVNFQALNEIIGLEEVAQVLTHLDISHNHLHTLDGIEKCIMLRYLNANHNELEDVSGLSSCNGLEELYMSHNNIRTLQCLRFLPKLRVLHVDHNELENVDDIVYLEEPCQVNAQYNQLSSIPPFDEFMRVDADGRGGSFVFNHNKIEKIEINKPVTVTRLEFGWNSIKHITGILHVWLSDQDCKMEVHFAKNPLSPETEKLLHEWRELLESNQRLGPSPDDEEFDRKYNKSIVKKMKNS